MSGYGSGAVGSYLSQVWRNTGTGFTNVSAGLLAVADGCVAWGDYDNDGKLDILLTGTTGLAGDPAYAVSKVYHNNGDGTFTDINAG